MTPSIKHILEITRVESFMIRNSARNVGSSNLRPQSWRACFLIELNRPWMLHKGVLMSRHSKNPRAQPIVRVWIGAAQSQRCSQSRRCQLQHTEAWPTLGGAWRRLTHTGRTESLAQRAARSPAGTCSRAKDEDREPAALRGGREYVNSAYSQGKAASPVTLTPMLARSCSTVRQPMIGKT